MSLGLNLRDILGFLSLESAMFAMTARNLIELRAKLVVFVNFKFDRLTIILIGLRARLFVFRRSQVPGIR